MRKTLASPCQSPYGASNSAVSPFAFILAWLGPAPAERGEELHEREVVDEPRVVAAEPLQRDDADRPRADAALASEPLSVSLLL